MAASQTGVWVILTLCPLVKCLFQLPCFIGVFIFNYLISMYLFYLACSRATAVCTNEGHKKKKLMNCQNCMFCRKSGDCWCLLGYIFTKKRDNSTTKCHHLSLDRRVLFHKIFTKGTKGPSDRAESLMLKI